MQASVRFIIIISAQTTCNQGMGRVMYERLPNQQLHGFDDDVVSICYMIITISLGDTHGKDKPNIYCLKTEELLI